jgi:hypothetical protein
METEVAPLTTHARFAVWPAVIADGLALNDVTAGFSVVLGVPDGCWGLFGDEVKKDPFVIIKIPPKVSTTSINIIITAIPATALTFFTRTPRFPDIFCCWY